MPSTPPSACDTSWRLWIELRMFLVRCASSDVNVFVSRLSGANRLNVPVRSATALGLGAAPVAEPSWNNCAPPPSRSSR